MTAKETERVIVAWCEAQHAMNARDRALEADADDRIEEVERLRARCEKLEAALVEAWARAELARIKAELAALREGTIKGGA